jgi:hypothetical protein
MDAWPDGNTSVPRTQAAVTSKFPDILRSFASFSFIFCKDGDNFWIGQGVGGIFGGNGELLLRERDLEAMGEGVKNLGERGRSTGSGEEAAWKAELS